MIEARKPDNEAERLAHLQALNMLDSAIEERFERITRLVCNILDVPISAISLVDDDRQWFKSVQGLNVSETPRSIAFCSHTILGDEALVVPDALADHRFADNPLVTENPNIRFYAGCPLIIEDGIRIGTLCAIDNKPREISEDQLVVLKDLAQMVRSEMSAITLSDVNQRLTEELKTAERAAMIDPLSGLWNRRGGEKLLESEWASASRASHSLSIAMIDIDHFKKVNDTYGHDIGDVVIRQFAKIILTSLRPRDVVCRWGGEEFLALFTDCDAEGLPAVLGRIQQNIESKPIRTTQGLLAVTASFGAAAVLPTRDNHPQSVIKEADRALYQAKAEGRARYVIANSAEHAN